MAEFLLETERLLLRDWRDADLAPFAQMCADERVMATLGPLMSHEETAELIERVASIAAEHGHTFWALERQEDGAFLGWCGLIRGSVGPIVGKPEIGWRLAYPAWGQGYAKEAAAASLDWGFANLPDPEIWAITSTGNVRSRGVMERLGMAYQPELDFDHPNVATDSPLLRHVTYRISRDQW